MLIAGWVLVVCLSVTPAVVPALVGFRAAVGLLARAESSLAAALLGASVRPGRWQSGGRGFWGRGRAVLQDGAFWRAQAYLGLRCTVGFVLGVAQLSLFGGAAFLVGLPIYYRWLHTGSHWQIDTLQKALLGVPVGVLGLLLLLRLVGPVASVWRGLADVLLRDESVPMPPAKRRQLLVVHVAIVAALDALFVLIWALSTWGGYFWPEWPIVVGAVPIAIHAWIERVDDRPELRRRRALAIHAGVYVALSVFFVLVWALTSRGSFWPEWAWLGLGIPLAAHAAIVFTRGELSDRIEVLETTRAGAVDVQETDLRRIERDLHDGAQARLVALGMNLGMAEQKFAADPAGARELVAEARVGVEEALRELRNLARGIHPPVLTDRGLGAAIEALADHSPLPVEVTITARRPARPGGRDRGVLRRRRSVDERNEARAGDTGHDPRRARRRSPSARGRRRRDGRRRSGRRRTEWPAPAGRSTRRYADRHQPAGRPDGRPRRSAVRVVIAEDLALLRDGLARLLRDNGFDVVAAVADGDALIHAAKLEHPDIAIVDIRLPPTFRDEGLRAALELRRVVPETAILVVSQYVERAYATELLAAGGVGIGYLLKDRILDVDEFVSAVRRVAEGGTALDPEVVAQLLTRRNVNTPLERLTPRELEVLSLMAEGRSNTAIAESLVLTVGAVEKHIAGIFTKLQLAQTGNDHRRVLAVLTYLQQD